MRGNGGKGEGFYVRDGDRSRPLLAVQGFEKREDKLRERIYIGEESDSSF